MSSFESVSSDLTSLSLDGISSPVNSPDHFFFPNNSISEETNGNFLLCKCIALGDINLDSESNSPLHDKVSKKELTNYIYNHNIGIKRSFNKQSKGLLPTIPDFQLD